MSDVQRILKAMEEKLHDGYLTEDMCYGLRMALDGIPEEYHLKAFEALIKQEEKADAE